MQAAVTFQAMLRSPKGGSDSVMVWAWILCRHLREPKECSFIQTRDHNERLVVQLKGCGHPASALSQTGRGDKDTAISTGLDVHPECLTRGGTRRV